MDKQKQINEMAKIMCGGCIENELMTCGFTHEEIPCDFAKNFAETLSNAGYRKIPENAVVLTREEYDDMFSFKTTRGGFYNILYTVRKVERKETADKLKDLVTRLKSLFDEYGKYTGYHINKIIDEIEEEITEDCK